MFEQANLGLEIVLGGRIYEKGVEQLFDISTPIELVLIVDNVEVSLEVVRVPVYDKYSFFYSRPFL